MSRVLAANVARVGARPGVKQLALYCAPGTLV